MNTTWLLFVLVLINILVLVAIVIWSVIFRGSLRKLLMSFIGLLIDNTTEDHKNEAIEMDKSEHKADIIKQRAKALSFEAALEQRNPPPLEHAIIPPQERGELARDTSDSGWPRDLDDEARHNPRPFLDIHLRTETVDSFEDESDTETNSDMTSK